jgi:hypothetical protein
MKLNAKHWQKTPQAIAGGKKNQFGPKRTSEANFPDNVK